MRQLGRIPDDYLAARKLAEQPQNPCALRRLRSQRCLAEERWSPSWLVHSAFHLLLVDLANRLARFAVFSPVPLHILRQEAVAFSGRRMRRGVSTRRLLFPAMPVSAATSSAQTANQSSICWSEIFV